MAIIGKVWTPEERLNYIYAFIKTDMKDINLDFYQQAYIIANYVYIAVLKSRQTGWSFSVALKGLAKAMDPARIKYTKQFVSYNEDDAMEKIRYAKEFYESIPKKYRKRLLHTTENMMEFLDKDEKTTSRLISVACRPPRGKNGDISLDEAAIYPPNRARSIYTAALYAITRGGCIEVGSTPLGSTGIFYDIINDKKTYPNYARYRWPWWYSSINCNDVEKAVQLAQDMTTEQRVRMFGKPILQSLFQSNFLEDFQQETECYFIDSASSYISMELIYANTPGMREGERDKPLADNDKDEEDLKEEKLEIIAYKTVDELINGYNPDIHGALYLGYDVARTRDMSVIFAIGLKDGKMRSVANIEMRGMKYEEQKARMRLICNSLPVVRSCIDGTGEGGPIGEALEDEIGHDKVESIIFTPESKEEMAIAVRSGLEQHDYLLQNDVAFQRQIHSIKRIITLTNHFRYDASRDDTGHADSFWAWALATHACKTVAKKVEKRTSSFYAQYAKSHGLVVPKTIVKPEDVVNHTDIIKPESTPKYIVPAGYRRLLRSGK